MEDFEEEKKGRGRPRKDTIELSLTKGVESVGDVNKMAALLMTQGLPKEKVAKRLNIDPRVVEQLEVIVKPVSDMVAGMGDDSDVENPVDDVSPNLDKSNYAVERYKNLLKSSSGKEGLVQLAAQLVKAELENQQLQENLGKPSVRGDDMGDTMFGNDDVKFLQEMYRFQMKMMMSKNMMKSMNFGGESESSGESETVRLLKEELKDIKKRDEMDRAIEPIKEQIKALSTVSNSEDLSPALKEHLDKLSSNMEKIESEKKHADLLADLVNKFQKNEDPLKYMKDIEEMKSRMGEKNRQIELQLQQAKDENMRTAMVQLQDNLMRKIEHLETGNRGGSFDITSLSGLKETLRTVKELSHEIGKTDVEDKPSLVDKVVDNALTSVPKLLDMAKDMKAKQKQAPQQKPYEIELSQDELDEIVQKRNNQLEDKKKQFSPKPLMSMPSDVPPEPPQRMTDVPQTKRVEQNLAEDIVEDAPEVSTHQTQTPPVLETPEVVSPKPREASKKVEKKPTPIKAPPKKETPKVKSKTKNPPKNIKK